jgi:hypothetical protein
MCTVTWTARPDEGYQLVFSRDEQRTRPAASPPRLTAHAGFSLLAPHDPPGGGTWIFANGHGLTACVLNFYDAPAPPAPPADGRESRGRLLQALAASPDPENFGQLLSQLAAPGRHLPCLLLAISPSARALAWTWDGRQLTPRAAPTPGFITTSSFDASRVVPARHAAYAAWREEAAQDLPAFHRAASVSPDAFSVRMSRPDARTVSLTEVVCAPAERLLSMSYFPREADGPFSSGQTWQLTLREPHDSF